MLLMQLKSKYVIVNSCILVNYFVVNHVVHFIESDDPCGRIYLEYSFIFSWLRLKKTKSHFFPSSK